MWKTREGVNQPNENLRNTIEKETTYRTSSNTNASFVKIRQILSETCHSFDIPCYLLDAANNVEKLNKVFFKSEPNEANLKIYGESSKSLLRKLADYQSIFDYYLISAKSTSNSPMKFRSSTLKGAENLKFIPINLHLENFLVEQISVTQRPVEPLLIDFNQDGQQEQPQTMVEKTCYPFTSVGAFTTYHTNKPNYKKTLEHLMISDKSFNFEKNRYIRFIDNEIVLHFYSLKLLIQLGDIIIDLRDVQFDDKSQVIQKIFSLTENIEIIHRTIIESYSHFFEQFVQLVRIEGKQLYFNLSEKLNYYRVKMIAITIEISNLVSNDRFDQLNDVLNMINQVLIEFYCLIMNDGTLDKFDFVNYCACFSQMISTPIGSVDLLYYKNPYMDFNKLKDLADFHMKNGLLVQIESMLSCFSTENGMVYDHYNAIQNLHFVHLHLPTDYSFNLNSNYSIDIQLDGFHIYSYSSFESSSKSIKIYPILVNVGINEQAISSSLFGNDSLQKFINTQAIVRLKSYFDNCRHDLIKFENRLDFLLNELKTNRSYVDDARPVELLNLIEEITRLLMGIRITNCKSGKDRTGMGVTFEQCMLLVRNHNLSTNMTQQILDDLRRNGTRLEIVKKNVGQNKYAFNKIRYYLLPKDYRPPFELCDDLET